MKYDYFDSQNRYLKDVAQENLKLTNVQRKNSNFMNNFNESMSNSDLSEKFSSLIKMIDNEFFTQSIEFFEENNDDIIMKSNILS